MPADKIGRNDPCPCGSGLKYKRCCLGNTEGQRASDAIDSFQDDLQRAVGDREFASIEEAGVCSTPCAALSALPNSPASPRSAAGAVIC